MAAKIKQTKRDIVIRINKADLIYLFKFGRFCDDEIVVTNRNIFINEIKQILEMEDEEGLNRFTKCV